MFTFALVSTASVALSVVAVVKLKQVMDMTARSTPNQCLLDGMHD